MECDAAQAIEAGCLLPLRDELFSPQIFWVDLHLHTVLSPCADIDMGAPEIIEKCQKEGVSVIAVTDHNHIANFKALRDAAETTATPPLEHKTPFVKGGVGGDCAPLLVLPGMEVQTMEDIHAVIIFPDEEAAQVYKDWLWEEMPPIKNREEKFGYQLIIDKDNNVIDQEEILLIQGAMRSIDDIAAKGLEMGCFVFLAHIDRPSFSYEVVLGKIPDDFKCTAFELSARLSHKEIADWVARYPGRTFLRSSDSHKLEQISRSRCTPMKLASLSFDEIRLALSGKEGRSVMFPPQE